MDMINERIQGNDVYNQGPNPPFSNNPQATNVLLSSPSTNYQTGLAAGVPTFPSSITALAYSDYKIPVAMQYSLGIQRQLSQAAVLNVAYVGSEDYHQPDERNINTLPENSPQRLQVCGGNCGYNGPNKNLDPDPYRIFPGFSNITMTEAATNSNYNSLQVSMNWRNNHGLSLQGSYTWSHELDYTSGDLNTLSDPFNRAYDYASGDLDRRHTAVFSYVYELPIFAHGTGFAHSILGGWELSGSPTPRPWMPGSARPLSRRLRPCSTGMQGAILFAAPAAITGTSPSSSHSLYPDARGCGSNSGEKPTTRSITPSSTPSIQLIRMRTSEKSQRHGTRASSSSALSLFSNQPQRTKSARTERRGAPVPRLLFGQAVRYPEESDFEPNGLFIC
jgi:hypothetical protein